MAEIDILGYAARLPGAADGDALWRLLDAGDCAVSEITPDRWSLLRYWSPRVGEPGKSYARWGGLVDDLWRFDAAFFGLSPREAEQLDPQQRLMIETSFRALEHAGLTPTALGDAKVGVYVGASSFDYAVGASFKPGAADSHFMTGSTLSILANRLSYLFGFHGPSVTLDTACSSSLFALNAAVEALRAGSVEVAVVSGVNVLLTPFPFIGFSQARMLSPTGRCRAFSADADGYVRAEGAVSLVLARPGAVTRDAVGRIVDLEVTADGSKRGSGINVPSEAGQQAAISAVLSRTGVDPNQLAFVEAHGTGTQVGDPIECAALGATLGRRRDAPLPIGSIKSNIGHLEPASGLAGVLKALMALERDRLPASLHADALNPGIDFDALNLRVARESAPLTPRAAGDAPRYAGVNSFGFGGTNAHVLLSDPAAATEPAATDIPPAGAALVISAASRAALAETARAYAERLEAHAQNGADGARSLAAAAYWRRAPREQGLCAFDAEADPTRLAAALRDTAARLDADDQDGPTSAPRAPDASPAAVGRLDAGGAVAFAFSGNGAQWAGMGQAAYRTDARFARSVDALSSAVEAVAGWSPRDALFDPDLERRLTDTRVAQPVLFVLQSAVAVALTELGLRPAFSFGHSVGEIAAAVAARKLSVADAARLVHFRSAHQHRAQGMGGMAALSRAPDAAAAAIAELGFPGVEIAGLNSSRHVTLSGPHRELDAFAKATAERRWIVKKLDLDYPFHSALLDPLRAPFLKDLVEWRPTDASGAAETGAPRFLSTVTGAAETGALDADYWWRNLRDPVRFADAAQAAIAGGARVFVEIGPKPILASYLRDALKTAGVEGAVLGSLGDEDGSAGSPIEDSFVRALAAGAAPADPTTIFGRDRAARDELPIAVMAPKAHPTPFGLGEAEPFRAEHPLLGWRADPSGCAYLVDLDPATQPFLADHRIGDRAVFPAAGFIELALAAAQRAPAGMIDGAGGDAPIAIRNLQITAGLFLPDDAATTLRVQLDPESRSVTISSRRYGADGDWSLHAFARYGRAAPEEAFAEADEEPEAGASEQWDADAVYHAAAAQDLRYGPAFRRVAAVRRTGDRRLSLQLDATPAPADTVAPGFDAGAFALDPMLLDAAFHGLFMLMEADGATESGGDGRSFVPVHIGGFTALRPGARPTRADLQVRRASERSILADVVWRDADGAAVARLTGARLRGIDFQRRERPLELVYRVEPADPAASAGAPAPDMDPVFRAVDAARRDQAEMTTASGAEPPSGSTALLREAAALRLAYDAVAATPARLATAPALATALDDAGLLERGDDGRARLVAAEGLPPFGALIEELLSEAPSEGAAATLLSAARARWLGEERGHKNGAVDVGAEAAAAGAVAASDAAQALIEHVEQSAAATAISAVEHALAARPVGAAATRILLCGDRTGAAASRLLRHLDSVSDAGAVGVTVLAEAAAATVAGALRQERSACVAADWDALGAERFDLIVELGGARLPAFARTARAHLTLGGVLLAFQPKPSLFQDLAMARDAQLGPAGEAEWRTACEAAGYDRVEIHDFDRLDALAVVARREGPRDGRRETRRETQRPLRDRTSATATATGRATALGPVNALGPVKPHAAPEPAPIMIVDGARFGADLAEELAALRLAAGGPGEQPPVIAATLDDPALLTPEFWRARAQSAAPRIVLALGGRAAMADGANAPAQLDAEAEATLVARACAALSTALTTLERPRIAITGPDGLGLSDLATAPALSALAGFARVAANEYPDARLAVFGAYGPTAAAAWLHHALSEPDATDGTAKLGGSSSGASGSPSVTDRALRDPLAADLGQATVVGRLRGELEPTRAAGAEPLMALDLSRTGGVDGLRWRPQAPANHGADAALGPNEALIDVVATGLNFRDVMWALRLLPDEALEDGFCGPTLGFECAGRVRAVGAGVAHLRAGQPVVAFGSGAFANRLRTDANAVLPLAPAEAAAEWDRRWDDARLAAAASAPVAYLTAHFALIEKARLQAGETVLIHGGAGAVGLAALDIAKRVGAVPLLTAGSPEKRALLRALGAAGTADSRSLSFEDSVRAATDGAGVDVVLNSLAGEPMERSLALLKPFGRFVELGKRDFYSDTKIGLRPFRANLSYFGVDVDQLLAVRPDLGRDALAAALGLNPALDPSLDPGLDPGLDPASNAEPPCQVGQIGQAEARAPSLPIMRFPAAEAQSAFRLMQRSGHIGKIVVSAPRPGERLRMAETPASLAFDPQAAHVIIGGLGGFGLETAAWMVDRGARTLWLASRRGAASGEAAAKIEALRARGARVEIRACDAADRAALVALLDEARASGPLKSVVHAPLALDDRLIADQTLESYETVCRVKIASAAHLDALTREDPLEQFILFSSATTLFGNPGQANYVAANAYLEGLARRRRAAGAPAIAPAWGAIRDVGVLTRDAAARDTLETRLGGAAITAREGLDALAAYFAIDDGSAVSAAPVIGRFDWSRAQRALPLLKAGLFERLRGRMSASAGPVEGQRLEDLIAGRSAEEAQAITIALIRDEVAKILRLSPQDVPTTKPIADIGMDSLMGLELRSGVQDAYAVEIPMSALADRLSIVDLADRLLSAKTTTRDADDADRDASVALARRHLGGVAEDGALDHLAAAAARELSVQIGE